MLLRHYEAEYRQRLWLKRRILGSELPTLRNSSLHPI